MPDDPKDSKVPDATMLAIDRTWLAHERTLMAWVRTAVSMISFAFTIYKFFEFEHAQEPSVRRGPLLTPRDFAIILISIGLISLVMASIGHYRNTRILKAQLHRTSMALIVAVLVGVFGILVFLSAILRS